MRSRLQSFFSGPVRRFTQSLEEFDRRISPGAASPPSDLVEELTASIDVVLAACCRVEAELRGEEPSRLKEVQARFRDEIWPWLDKSWFMHRALTKPRGYPGDYELLSAIYDGQPKSRGLGGCLDRYFLNTTLGRAVVSRMQAARLFLLDELDRRPGKTTVLNVACGSCREFLAGFNPPADRQLAVTCVDNDVEALDYVRTRVAPRVAGRVAFEFVRYNALRMTSVKSNVARFGHVDVVYSVGLCDYIPDEYLIPMLKAWRETLSPGGTAYVAFKDSRRYRTAEYQWLVDWHFFQRTEEDHRRLFEQAGYDMATLRATRDETGSIVNYLSRVPSDVVVRVDAAETVESPHVEGITQANQAQQP